jgi:hypothetical protein
MALLIGLQPNLRAESPSFANWQPVPSHREDRGNVKVVWLQGTPYEMGYQHGTLLHDEIASMGTEIIDALRILGRGLGLSRLAVRRSPPDIAEECRGLADATADIGMTFDGCMVLAFGDVYQEFFAYVLPEVMFNDGCSQFVASGQATKDGYLYHGSSLDNNGKPIDYWIENSTVFIRQPNDGIPHVFISVPGMLWPNWGMNAAGISIGLDTAHPLTIHELSLEGGSNVQIMAQILKEARTFEEARALMASQNRMRANLIMVADGNSKQAGVFELLGQDMAVRELSEAGVVYVTNHFVSDELAGRDEEPPSISSPPRFERFAQLLEPDGLDSRYGELDPPGMVRILRDRINPYTQIPSPLDVYDDDASIGGNGSLRQGVFDPAHLRFWVAAGNVPVPENPFVCFSFGEMIGMPNATPCNAPIIE